MLIGHEFIGFGHAKRPGIDHLRSVQIDDPDLLAALEVEGFCPSTGDSNRFIHFDWDLHPESAPLLVRIAGTSVELRLAANSKKDSPASH